METIATLSVKITKERSTGFAGRSKAAIIFSRRDDGRSVRITGEGSTEDDAFKQALHRSYEVFKGRRALIAMLRTEMGEA